ncbi:conserved hypothetical protein [Theileria equi strain WA]|uniref:Small ribosomal subunit protein mS23 n=1 Tax=Theileria equi strain WA TaxID=1537102 RepID=L1LDT2_THEEQ|nr:conserved hypothetical protein [Theileria equi strain WA]EKX73405.1 conserved hypothetical protein [Theileria equi strain WA]|eukprot:XP_004832857.1 conserved hypothetical protein [Theileria equi strain WA]
MAKGAIHITGSNFAIRRRLRWDILDRGRKLVNSGTIERPRWLDWVEMAPPLETRNLLHTDKVIKNPYIPLVTTLLKKYPHLRFEKCFDSGNEWQKGVDNYNVDHPVMQFVAYQLSLMNKGMSKTEAFMRTEKVFYRKRMEIEKNLKVAMALAIDEEAVPLYTTGFAYWNEKLAEGQGRFLIQVRNELRRIKEEVLKSQKQLEDKKVKSKP